MMTSFTTGELTLITKHLKKHYEADSIYFDFDYIDWFESDHCNSHLVMLTLVRHDGFSGKSDYRRTSFPIKDLRSLADKLASNG